MQQAGRGFWATLFSSDQPLLSPQDEAEHKRQAAKARQAFWGFALPWVFACIPIAIATFFIAGPDSGPKLAIALPTVILVLALSWQYPRQALWGFLLYMPFAGTVVYWLAGGSAIMQLAKDGFYIPALIGLLLQARQHREAFVKPKGMMPALVLLLIICGFALLVVSLPKSFLAECTPSMQRLKQVCREGQPLFMGLLGLKVFLGYVPLIFCTQQLIRTRKELLFFSRSHVILAITCCGLCLMQYLMLRSGRCAGTDHLEGDALFKATLEAKCLVGGSLVYSPTQGIIRLPGTFVAPWQWGWFLIANAYLTFAAAFSDPSALWRLIGLIGMGSVTMGAVISGQRIALVLVPLSFILLAFLTGQIKNLRRFIPIAAGLGVLIVIGLTLYPEIVQERIDSFVGRWEASPADQMIAQQFDFVWKDIHDKPLGMGLGTATNSARMFGPTALIETWFPKVMFEVGIIGLGAFLAFVTVLSVMTFKTYRSLKEKNLRSFAACYWVFVLFIGYQTYYYPLDVDPVAVYYWVLIGIIFRLPALEKQLSPGGPKPESASDNLSGPQQGVSPPRRFSPVRGTEEAT